MGEALISRRGGGGGEHKLFFQQIEGDIPSFSYGNNYMLDCGFRPKCVSIFSRYSELGTNRGEIRFVLIDFERSGRCEYYYSKTYYDGSNVSTDDGGVYVDLGDFKVYQRENGIEFVMEGNYGSYYFEYPTVMIVG